MNVTEIIDLVEIKSEEFYEEELWTGFINLAIDDLTPVAKLLKTVTLAGQAITNGGATIAIAGTDLQKAHEFIHVYVTITAPSTLPKRRLRRLDISNHISRGWKLTYENLVLQGLGDATEATIDVDIYKKADHVEELTDVPEIPEQYHNLIVLYVCAKSQQKEEELTDKNDFFAEYLMGKHEMARDRTYEMEPRYRKLIRKSRISARTNMPTDK